MNDDAELQSPEPATGGRPEVPAPGPDTLWIPGGVFRIGSDQHYPEERPVHPVRVDGFWMDRTPVTNRQFREFVDATGYVTFAEIAPDPKDYPGALPNMLKAGSLVFSPPRRAVDLRDWSQWWRFKFGANWRRPYGPGGAIPALDDHRSCTSPIATRKPPLAGRPDSCRPRRNGNSHRAAAWTARSSPGVTSSLPVGFRCIARVADD